MLLGDDLTPPLIPPWLPYLLGPGGMALGAVVMWALGEVRKSRAAARANQLDDEARADKRKLDNAERDDKDVETAIQRVERVMQQREEFWEKREADCDKRITALTKRVDDLEQDRRNSADKLSSYIGRNKYLEHCSRSGIKPDPWDETQDDSSDWSTVTPPPSIEEKS